MSDEALAELVFMMVILKIPVLYLCGVVYWAVRAQPRPLEPALGVRAPVRPDDGPSPGTPPRHRRPRARRRPPLRPHGGPVRTYARGRVPAARTEAD
ncbi:MAG: hypothetical protein ICV64_11950 [Thermoleophilia bacterium]|nr:hypothetical protein [Thermoleophilia bacterium]